MTSQDLEARITALETELRDTKRQLHEMTIAKGKVDLEKRELESLLLEAHGSVRDVEEVNMTDRAKRMLVTLRMQRFSERTHAIQAAVRKKCAAAASSVKSLREECTRTKAVYAEQMNRVEVLFTRKLEQLQQLISSFSVTIAPSSHSHRVVMNAETTSKESPGDLSSSHLSLSFNHAPQASSVENDQLYSASVMKLVANIDTLIKMQNLQWSGLDTFMNGPIPQVSIPRHFKDPLINLQNYANVVTSITGNLNRVATLSVLTSEMRAPSLTRVARSAITDVDAKYNRKLTTLTNAMRAVRTAVGLKKSASGVLRIVMSVDVAREEGKLLLQQYRAMSLSHTVRCFRYIGNMFILVKRYVRAIAEDRRNRIGMDPEHFVDDGVGAEPPADPSSGSSEVRCIQCGIDLTCYDCSHAKSYPKCVANIINHRRWLVMQFTHFRVQHFQNLMGLLDQVGALLKKLKLIPSNWEHIADEALSKPLLLAVPGTHGASSHGGHQHHHPAPKPPVTESDASKMILEGLAKLQVFQYSESQQQQQQAPVLMEQPPSQAQASVDPSVESVGPKRLSMPRGGGGAPTGAALHMMMDTKHNPKGLMDAPLSVPAAAANRSASFSPSHDLQQPSPHNNGIGSANYFAELRKRKAHLKPTDLVSRTSALNDVSSAAASRPSNLRLQLAETSARVAQTEFVEDTLRVLDYFSPRKPSQLVIKQRPHFLEAMLVEQHNNTNSSLRKSSVRHHSGTYDV